MQQRALSKYHWAGIWSNTCCSHPRINESYLNAAQRRLFEELGIKTPLTKAFHFIYKATDIKSGLIEHEYDTVFTGIYDGDFEFNKEEVEATRWMSKKEILQDILANEDEYSFWFKIILKEFEERNML